MSESYFIYVGRLDELKGVKLLFKAWNQMGKEAFKLKVCGIGPLDGWCHEFIENNSDCNIELLGFVPNNEVKELIANAIALILPTQWYEGFPMTVLEAYSVGTPVIGSDIGNVGSLVENDITGYKFCSESVLSLEQAVKKMTEILPNKKNIKQIYDKKYSEEENYKILNDIYNQVYL